jgi:anthranilate phosphoribosyltransferase
LSAILQQTLAAILERKDLTRDEARQAMECILAGECTPAQIAGFAVALRMKGERPAEIAGMAEAMRARVPPILTTRRQLLDTCGTGGDNSGTFNISTTVAIVAASCGVAIAKHGNRAMSSRAGSADVLEQLGVSIELTPEDAARAIDEVGLAFLFAPNYHVSLRHASGPRRELGVRTVFNLLGPLTNPAGARRQLLGVYMDPLVRLVAEVLRNLGSERAWIVHSRDGLDEISVFAPTHVAELRGGGVEEFEIDPQRLGLAHENRAAIAGGSAAENAARIRAVLGGEPGAARDVVVLNAAAALVVAEIAASLEEGVALAQRALDSGAAADKLGQLAAFRP